MKILSSLFILLIAQLGLADTVIVPSKEVDLSTFLQRCHKTGYICSHDFVTEKLILAPTPKFDQLIENLDLLSDDQRKQLPTNILELLKTELINLEQLNALTQIIEKVMTFDKSSQLNFLLKELSEVHQTLMNQIEKENEETIYIVFKKRLTSIQFEKIKYKIQNYKYFTVNPFQIAEKNVPDILLLTGNCLKKYISPLLTTDQYSHQIYPLFQNDCSSDFNFQSTIKSVSEFTDNNKSTILWSIAAVGAAIFINNYTVEFK